ncbi:MAG: hypothetical protein Sv326_1339 (plasmid) [Candidatus Fermentimicrarchaeum limneticum]|uniref:Uncharacterized protein n=1 Tax=Fermentimicrarchaeum limneticum TaxID=2795018 RepID=A0A7D5XIU2_FERL1|nr:MAG: hypothetical protein Sv326_1339 [Candidatus Fermentimicrarchaeum limneticum]
MKIRFEQGKHNENDRKIFVKTEGEELWTLLQKLFVVRVFRENEWYRWEGNGSSELFRMAMEDILRDTPPQNHDTLFENIAMKYWQQEPKRTEMITEARKLDEKWKIMKKEGRKDWVRI